LIKEWLIQKNHLEGGFFAIMVPVGGLEPPRIAATDFESVVSTNSTTPALNCVSNVT
jgi:hypothetical protein